MKSFSAFLRENTVVVNPNSLAIRDDLPQLKDINGFIDYLTLHKVSFALDDVSPSIIKPTQGDFDLDKVDKLKGNVDPEAIFVVDQDMHLLDGHHRMLAAQSDNMSQVRVLKVNTTIAQLIQLGKDFNTQSVNEAVTGMHSRYESQIEDPKKVPGARQYGYGKKGFYFIDRERQTVRIHTALPTNKFRQAKLVYDGYPDYLKRDGVDIAYWDGRRWTMWLVKDIEQQDKNHALDS